MVTPCEEQWICPFQLGKLGVSNHLIIFVCLGSLIKVAKLVGLFSV